MRSEGRDIDIGGMMDRWTLQMGYPVVTISKNQSEQLPTHYITVSQEHFLYGQEVRNNNRQVLKPESEAADRCVKKNTLCANCRRYRRLENTKHLYICHYFWRTVIQMFLNKLSQQTAKDFLCLIDAQTNHQLNLSCFDPQDFCPG